MEGGEAHISLAIPVLSCLSSSFLSLVLKTEKTLGRRGETIQPTTPPLYINHLKGAGSTR